VSSVVVLFFLIMALHPWIQRKLQEEVDAVVGDGRVPNMSDFDNMPYMQCVIKELHRYNPVIPLVPHSPVQDDVYEGYVVPKGAWVMANVWSVLYLSKMPFVYLHCEIGRLHMTQKFTTLQTSSILNDSRGQMQRLTLLFLHLGLEDVHALEASSLPRRCSSL